MIKLLELLSEKSPCWKGYKQIGMKDKDGRQVPNCVPINEDIIDGEIECEKCGWKWKLADGGQEPYLCHKCDHDNSNQINEYDVESEEDVKNPKTGKVVKVNFGAKGMNIKKNNPVRRKAFRARHNCINPGPRTKARYWSCRKW
jgi:DNA-directed RNA polymerase subunit RPC12/RpoP